ncbi:SDR family oxidoreductase [Xanthobacter sp. DSM 24535]|uniref:SDR family oxidoreductase n=1 Tax=Roseixanthobacter psychrophilus TaxID=3119917 RepID=UPI0037279958
MSLEGKVVIVTGSGSGIGKAAATFFVRDGAKVVIADSNEDAAQETAAALGPNARAVRTDVSQDADVRAMVDFTVAQFGRIDVLVNNAGFGFTGTVVSIAEADWDRLMSVNLKGVFLCSKHVIPLMAAQGGGTIVNTGSYTAMVGIADRAAYVASKGGVVALTRAMALDHVHQNIRVNAVAPGTVHSPYFDRMFAQAADPAAMKKALDDRAPMHRMGRPEEIAEAILWLASDKSAFATGSTLTIDGGTSIW